MIFQTPANEKMIIDYYACFLLKGTGVVGELCSAVHVLPQYGVSFSLVAGGTTGQTNTLTCQQGYTSSATSNVMICDANGIWTNKPTCVREYKLYLQALMW